ncbi:MAG: hypothetical protein ACREJD_17440 [Phycisphaerales bacterium]
MPNPNALYTKALAAKEVAIKLAAVAADVFPTDNMTLQVGAAIDGIRFSTTMPGSQLSEGPDLAKFLETLKEMPTLQCASASVEMQHNSQLALNYSTPDGLVGELTVRSSGDRKRAIPFLKSIKKHFHATSYQDLIRSSAPTADQAALLIRERSVADLNESLQKMQDFLTDLYKREADLRQKLQSEMEASHRARTDDLEKEYRDRQALLDKRKQETEDADAKREKAFQERVAEFETKESKYVRRELLKQTLNVVTGLETMSLSDATGEKRRWIHGFSWLLIVASGTLAGFAAARVLQAEQADWHYLALLSGSFVTFVASLVYYLKWNDRWFREHADGEFSAKRYKADMLRASWIAELIQEWAQQGKGDLPPELLSAFTRSMFRDAGPSQVSEHPVDDITALIKRATRVDIGKGLFSVTASPLLRRAHADSPSSDS